MADDTIDPHGPLTGQEIRLLEIYPSEFTSDILKCRRICVNLSRPQRHSYEALSYVWGDEMKRVDIVCDGTLVSVTTSLYNALKGLRLPRESRFIWADAICIDQSNSLEKNIQIPLMGKIYSSADRVVVWLGEADPVQTEGCEIVQLIANHIRRARDEKFSDTARLPDYETLQIPSDYANVGTQAVLRCLYAEPWFSRIWCIQEIALAKDAIMLWGPHELSWADVGIVALWLTQIVPTRALEYDMDAWYADIETSHAYQMYVLNLTHHDLLRLLNDCNTFKATDPRDRVYGLLALVEPKEEAEALCIDYNKSVAEVYADTVIAMIRLYSTLDALAYVNHGIEYRRCDENFTSWTPRWHENESPRRIPAFGSPLSACRNVPVKKTGVSHINSRHLCLAGLFYSEITTVQVGMNKDNMDDIRAHPFLEVYNAIVGERETDAAREEAVSMVLARTLTAGCNNAMDDIITLSVDEQHEFHSSFLMLISSLKAGVDYITTQKTFTVEESFYEEAEIVCTQRRIFQTGNGNFGLGPASAREGDIVVVLFGGNTPYVLRPYGDSYLFIGQAYVDDLMQGQLVDEMEAGRAEEQVFCLV